MKNAAYLPHINLKHLISKYITLLNLIISVIITLGAYQHIALAVEIKNQTIQIGGKKISVEISDTNTSRRIGLTGRTHLALDHGMLFVFPNQVQTPFWMKGMKMAIDIVWIRNEKVVALAENIPPPSKTHTKTKILQPKNSFNHVLEISAGWIKANNIKLGDPVSRID